MVSTGQLVLLIMSVVLFAASVAISLARLWSENPRLRLVAKACQWSGVTIDLAVLAWHGTARGDWRPFQDSFDAFIWLGVFLSLFVLYTQRTRPIGGLDWFVTPIVILVLLAAAVFGKFDRREYNDSAWMVVHRVAAYGGALAFAIAGAAGAMYLLAHRRLRQKTPSAGPRLGSLERLEHLTLTAVTVGFALMTVPVALGMLRIVSHHSSTVSLTSPKVVLGLAVWVVYALVLTTPITPALRGPKMAVLSIVGFLLMAGAVVATQFTAGVR